MSIALFILAYIVVGMIIGRVWYTICMRRKLYYYLCLSYPTGIFWPVIIVLWPAVLLFVFIVEKALVPTVTWMWSLVDKLVAFFVKEQTEEPSRPKTRLKAFL